MEALTKAVHKLIPFSPVWSSAIGKSPPPVFRSESTPELVYFPACVTRIMGSSNLGKASVTETVLTVAARAGIKVLLPKSVTGVCCSQIWKHRGYADGRRYMANHLVESMWDWSDGGRVQVMCDVTSCTQTILREVADELTEENAARYRQIKVIDIAPWLLEDVMPRLEVTAPKQSVALHPTCACVELGVDKQVQALGRACAQEAVTPAHWGCCGVAGDRGFMYPELSDGAQRDEHAELAGRVFDGYYSRRANLRDRTQRTLRAPVRVDRLPRRGGDAGKWHLWPRTILGGEHRLDRAHLPGRSIYLHGSIGGKLSAAVEAPA